MDQRINALERMLTATADLIGDVDPDHHGRPTPCEAFTVADLLEHMAVWVQVFDATVNDSTVVFNPETHRIGEGWDQIVANSGKAIVEGLRTDGFARTMTMAGSELPGQMVLNMLLMEYVGHCWDLSRACELRWEHDEGDAAIALEAARSIVQPEHRQSPMFGPEVAVGADASALDHLVAFVGRDPGWRAKDHS